MPGDSTRLRLLICHDDPALQQAIAVVADRAGFDIAAVVTTGADAVGAVALHRPDAVVLDVALTGVDGLPILARLQDAAPLCATIVLSPFEALRGPARDAGAYDIAPPSDLRQLEWSLGEVHGSVHAGCTCGETGRLSGTSSTFDGHSATVRLERGPNSAGDASYGEESEEPPDG